MLENAGTRAMFRVFLNTVFGSAVCVYCNVNKLGERERECKLIKRTTLGNATTKREKRPKEKKKHSGLAGQKTAVPSGWIIGNQRIFLRGTLLHIHPVPASECRFWDPSLWEKKGERENTFGGNHIAPHTFLSSLAQPREKKRKKRRKKTFSLFRSFMIHWDFSALLERYRFLGTDFYRWPIVLFFGVSLFLVLLLYLFCPGFQEIVSISCSTEQKILSCE